MKDLFFIEKDNEKIFQIWIIYTWIFQMWKNNHK